MDLKTTAVLPISDPDDRERLKGWLLCVGQHRDSTILEQSNFIVARQTLDKVGAEYEVLGFNHWAVGWIEELAVHPDYRQHVEAIMSDLADYPILDEMHYSEMQFEQASEAGCESMDDGRWLHVESGEIWSEDSFD